MLITTLTDLANLALSKIGERKDALLTDLDTDTSDNAETCRRFMETVIQSVQSNFYWDENVVRAVLATPEGDITEDPAYDYAYRYLLPEDYLSPIFYDETTHEVEGGYVYCNWSENYVFKYKSYNEDPTKWTSQQLTAIVFELALAICVPITENVKKHNLLLQEYEQVQLPRAERSSAFGKKYPKSRRIRGVWGRTRGPRNLFS